MRKIVDFNAHIENLKCTVTTENGIAYGLLSFQNLGYGTLNAVKLIATGLNSFGDDVFINGKINFFIILQDLNIAPNCEYNGAKIKLPNNEIRNITIAENQLIYSDGSNLSYKNSDIREYEIDYLNELDDIDIKILEVLRDYEPTAICLSKETLDGWICVCGHLNRNSNVDCTKCSKEKISTFAECTEDSLIRAIENKRQKKEFIARRNKQMEIKKAKQRKKQYVFFAICSVIVIMIMGMIVNASILSSRVIYSSIEEMQNDLKGTWVHYGADGYSVLWSIDIDGDTLIQNYYSPDVSLETTVTYNPSRGYFKVFSNKYTIKKSGYNIILIESDKYEYEKGYTSPYSPSTPTITTPSTSSKFDTYLNDNNVTLDNSDVQYNMANNVDNLFSLVGYAELDDYYNYGFDDDIESTYFCLEVTPSGGSYSDKWFIYCHRDSLQKLFDKVKDNGTISVQMVCKIPSYRFEENQQCMAELQYVVY